MKPLQSWKENEKKSNKYRKNVSSTGHKFNSIESIISKALTHAEISHEQLALIGSKTEKISDWKKVHNNEKSKKLYRKG